MTQTNWRDLIRVHQPTSQISPTTLDVTHPFEADVASLNLLARGPLAHLGMAHLDVYFEEWDGTVKLHGMPGAKKVRPADRPSIWFDSLFDNLCVFAVEEESIAALHQATAALAPACVDAFCAFHALPDDAWPRQNEERLAAVHALGLGPLLSIAS